MKRETKAVIRIAWAVVIVAALAVAGTGCNSLGSSRKVGLPENVKVVGGGFSINWQAPEKGTVYLVENTSGKILVTQALDDGEYFEFETDPEDDAAAFGRATGVQVADARLMLYFQPAPQ